MVLKLLWSTTGRLSSPFDSRISKTKQRRSPWATILCKVDWISQRCCSSKGWILLEYVDGQCYFGCIVGRVGSRIKNARFELDGNVYELEKNDGTKKHHLHGVFNQRVWESSTENGDTVVFKYQSPDGELSPVSATSRKEFAFRRRRWISRSGQCDCQVHVNEWSSINVGFPCDDNETNAH